MTQFRDPDLPYSTAFVLEPDPDNDLPTVTRAISTNTAMTLRVDFVGGGTNVPISLEGYTIYPLRIVRLRSIESSLADDIVGAESVVTGLA